MFDTQANDDFTFPVRVSRVDNGIDVVPPAKRLYQFKLAADTGVFPAVGALFQFKMKLLGETGEIFHRPPLSVRVRVVVLYIGERKQMTERPCDKVRIAREKTVLLFHTADGIGNVARKTGFFRDNQNHGSLLSFFARPFMRSAARAPIVPYPAKNFHPFADFFEGFRHIFTRPPRNGFFFMQNAQINGKNSAPLLYIAIPIFPFGSAILTASKARGTVPERPRTPVANGAPRQNE